MSAQSTSSLSRNYYCHELSTLDMVAFSYLLLLLQGSENQEQEANNNISEMEDGLAPSPGASSDSPKEVGNVNRPVVLERGREDSVSKENVVLHREREGRGREG